MTYEFKTYRHFEIKPDYIGSCAVHKDYDGPEDSRYFHDHAPTREVEEETLIYAIDNWYEDQTTNVLRGLVGLFDLILKRDDLPSLMRTAIEMSWRYHDALDLLDSSRGTVKVDSEEAAKV